MDAKKHSDPGGTEATALNALQAEFLRRGEAAWQEYLRTRKSVSAEEVFAHIEAKIEEKRASLLAAERARINRR